MRTIIPALMLVAVVALAAGCGAKKKTETTAAGASTVSGTTITIDEKDFSLSPAAVTITKPGTYTINGVNKGGTSHAIAIEGNGVTKSGATVDPGGTSTITVDITKPGAYALFCPVGNHRALGMVAALTLTGSGSAGGATSTADTSNGYG